MWVMLGGMLTYSLLVSPRHPSADRAADGSFAALFLLGLAAASRLQPCCRFLAAAGSDVLGDEHARRRAC